MPQKSKMPIRRYRRVLSFIAVSVGLVALLPVAPSAAAPKDTRPPTAPANLEMTDRTASSISLVWGAATDNVGVTSYEVWRGDAKYGAWVRVATVPGTSLRYSVTGLAPSTTYSFGIRAFDAARNRSASSNAITASTTSATATTAPSPAPTPTPTASPTPTPTPSTTTAPSTTPTASDPTAGITWRRSASFETDLNTGTNGWNLPPLSQVAGFGITRTNEVGGANGSYAAKITSTGGNTGCSCPRMKFEDGFSYRSGRDVWLRGSWYFPNPSALTWSRMMNLGSYTGGTNDYYTGLVIENGSGQMLVRSRNYHSSTGQKLIFPPRPIPVGRWFTAVLHFKLSPIDGQALNEWYIDGQLVGTSTVANMVNDQALNTYQAGMPYFLNGVNTSVYFDNPGLKD